jgi:hypothetical protein
MKRIFILMIITTLTGSLLTFNSCSEDFLSKEPPGVAAGTVMESPEGVEALLIGCYSSLQGRSRFGDCLGTDWTYGSGASDDTYKGSSSGDQTAFNSVEKYECLPDNPYMRDRWQWAYDGVARCNTALEFLVAAQAGERPLATARATEAEAEIKFLRAWFHFKLNNVFEKIPYIKTQEELGDIKPEEVPNPDPGWTDLEADLQFAIDNLPTSHPLGEVGRANKYAAMAVKAWVHMTKGELSLAKPLLDGIINSGQYSLVSNYFDNYDMTHENNSESIFEIQCATSGSNQSSVLVAGPSMHQSGPAGLGWGFHQPSENLFEAFQVDANGLPVLDPAARDPLANDMGIGSGDNFVPTDHLIDPRVDWTVSRRGIDFLGWGICEGASWIREQSNGGPYMTKKFMQKSSEQSLNAYGRGFDNGKNYRAITLGHVLLWRAEIHVADNELDEARLKVNMIRDRAKTSDVVMGLCTSYTFGGGDPVVDYNQPAANYLVEPYPPGAAAFATQAEAMKAVQMETRLEFATQGFRFFDLRRWGIDGAVLNAYIAEDSQFRIFLQGASYDPDKDDYWPLPLDQLDIQPNLTQDPAYN